MTALRPCPFCGGKAQIMEAAPEDNRHILFRHFSVKCKSCKVIIGNVIHGETDFFDTPEQGGSSLEQAVIHAEYEHTERMVAELSSDMTKEELDRYVLAASVADRIFPRDSRGKYLRPIAKRVSDNTEIPYQEALDLLYGACVGAIAYRLAGDSE